MKEKAKHILRKYLTVTDGIRNKSLDRFYGPDNRFARQIIMEAITGEKKPLSKCGWYNFRDAMINFFEIDRTGKCSAAIDDEIIEKIFEFKNCAPKGVRVECRRIKMSFKFSTLPFRAERLECLEHWLEIRKLASAKDWREQPYNIFANCCAYCNATMIYDCYECPLNRLTGEVCEEKTSHWHHVYILTTHEYSALDEYAVPQETTTQHQFLAAIDNMIFAIKWS